MRKPLLLTHALLWASAVLASALLHAPTALTLVVLPTLSVAAWLSALALGRRRLADSP